MMDQRRIEALDRVTDKMREEAAVEMDGWTREWWDRWDAIRLEQIHEHPEINNSDAQWIAYLKCRSAASKNI